MRVQREEVMGLQMRQCFGARDQSLFRLGDANLQNMLSCPEIGQASFWCNQLEDGAIFVTAGKA